MGLSDKDKKLVKAIFDQIPQKKAYDILTGKGSDNSGNIIVGIEDVIKRQLTAEEIAVMDTIATYDKDARVALAGQLIGKVVEQATEKAAGGFMAWLRSTRLYKFIFG
jgi:hypothetical protein